MESSVLNGPSITTAVSQELSDWEVQLLEIAEAEKWEGSLFRIPFSLQKNFKILMDKINLQNRIASYKLLDLLGWEQHYCECYYSVLSNIALDNVSALVSMWKRYSADLPVLKILIELSIRFSLKLVNELITQFTLDEVDNILDNIRFLSLHELDLVCHSMEVMNISGFMNMLKICDEIQMKANQCRLCRTKRIIALEFKMQQGLMPVGLIPTTGTLVLHEQTQNQWTAADDTGYTFDSETGSVYWRKQLVDVVRICDTCLVEMQAAVASEGRFVEYHHIESTARKAIVTELRSKEQSRARFIQQFSLESEHRRAREVCQRVVASYRQGVRLEREEKERVETEKTKRVQAQMLLEQRNYLSTEGLKTDNKWKASDRLTSMKYLSDLNDAVNLKLHPGFSDQNPVSTIREHPYSWQLQHYDTTSNPELVGQATTIITRKGLPAITNSNNGANINTHTNQLTVQNQAMIAGFPSSSMSLKSQSLSYDIQGAGGHQQHQHQQHQQSNILRSSTNNILPNIHHHHHGIQQHHHQLLDVHQSQSMSRSLSMDAYPNNPTAPLVRLGGGTNHLGIDVNQPLPLTQEAASHRFGLSTFAAQVQFEALTSWKQQGDAGHVRYLNKLASDAKDKQDKDRTVYEERVAYVANRMRDMNRRDMRDRRHREQAEVDRIEARAEDRNHRRGKRLAGYEARETKDMSAEDTLSWWVRYHEKEKVIYTRERENMFNEECEQTAIDRFWGLFSHSMAEQLERERRERVYNARVEEMRIKCVQAHIIRPYDWEAKGKVIHDFFTHEPIT